MASNLVFMDMVRLVFLDIKKVRKLGLCHRPVIPATQEPEAGESQVQDPPGLCSEFPVSLSNLVKVCLKA